ncbi:hypothetical protein AOLI_G00175900 [Acnodon oligacanthus]
MFRLVRGTLPTQGRTHHPRLTEPRSRPPAQPGPPQTAGYSATHSAKRDGHQNSRTAREKCSRGAHTGGLGRGPAVSGAPFLPLGRPWKTRADR